MIIFNNLKYNLKKILDIQKFKKHNNQLFQLKEKKNKNNDKFILVEFNKWSYLHIIKSYVANIVSKKYNAKIYAFENYTLIADEIDKNFIQKIYQKFLIFFSLGTFGIYKSFGVQKFIVPKINKKNMNLKKQNLIFNQIRNKKDFLNLKINNIHVGDLFYDTYLKVFKCATINIKDQKFKKFIFDCFNLFDWWYEYISKNKKLLKSIIVVHTVYSFGLVTRIANQFKIKSLKISHKSIIKIDKKNKYITDDVNKNKDNIKFFNSRKINKFAKKNIKSIVSGRSKTGKNYNTRLKNRFKILSRTGRKILVSCHSFSDAPHVYGNFFKNDFYDWLNFLGEISNKTRYTWLIKPHPLTYDQDIGFIKNLINKYPNFFLIDKKYSNQEILNTKIDLALTCFGTINFEYPFMNIKVLNFSKNHQFNSYNFSYTPKNINEYKKILMNISKFKYNINKQDIYNWYFLKRFFLDVDFMNFKLHPTKDLDGYLLRKRFYETGIYLEWIKKFNKDKHLNIFNNVKNFLDSRDYYLNQFHLENNREKFK